MSEDYDKYPAPTEEELESWWSDKAALEDNYAAARLIHDIRCLRRKLSEYDGYTKCEECDSMTNFVCRYCESKICPCCYYYGCPQDINHSGHKGRCDD